DRHNPKMGMGSRGFQPGAQCRAWRGQPCPGQRQAQGRDRMTMAIAVRRTEHNQMGGAAARLRVKRAGGGNAALKSAMLAMGEPLRASGGRLMSEWKAQHHPRYRIGNGAGLFLSGDGQGVVSCSREAWFGTIEQAE